MNTFKAIVELSKSLTKCKKKEDRTWLKHMMTVMYDRATKDETPSRLKELEDKVSQLSIRAGFTSE